VMQRVKSRWLDSTVSINIFADDGSDVLTKTFMFESYCVKY
jgi:hypothetical protein